MPPIDKDWIATLYGELQEVPIDEARAEQLCQLLNKLNATALAHYPRTPFESEPSHFLAALHRHKDDWGQS